MRALRASRRQSAVPNTEASILVKTEDSAEIPAIGSSSGANSNPTLTRNTNGSSPSSLPNPISTRPNDVLTNPVRPNHIRPPSTPPRPSVRTPDLADHNTAAGSHALPSVDPESGAQERLSPDSDGTMMGCHPMDRPTRSVRGGGQEASGSTQVPIIQTGSEPKRKKGKRGKGGKGKGKDKGKGKENDKGKGKANANPNARLPTVANVWADDEEMFFNEVDDHDSQPVRPNGRMTTRRVVLSPPAEPEQNAVASSSTITKSHGRQVVHSPATEPVENAVASSSAIPRNDTHNTGDKRPAVADLTDVTSMNLGFKVQLERLEQKKKDMAIAQAAEERQLASLAEALARQREKVTEMRSAYADIDRELEDLNHVKAAYERYGKRIKTR